MSHAKLHDDAWFGGFHIRLNSVRFLGLLKLLVLLLQLVLGLLKRSLQLGDPTVLLRVLLGESIQAFLQAAYLWNDKIKRDVITELGPMWKRTSLCALYKSSRWGQNNPSTIKYISLIICTNLQNYRLDISNQILITRVLGNLCKSPNLVTEL